MPYFEVCPQCGSEDIDGNRYRGVARCLECGFSGINEEIPVHYTAALKPEVIAACRKLSAGAEWVEPALEEWPGPIAHELHRLRELVDEGQVIGAVWQLKDVAEVLIKFPAVVMARDYLEHGRDERTRDRIRSGLFSKLLAMGDWHKLAGDLLAPALSKAKGDPLLLPRLAGLFRGGKGKPTKAYNLLLALNNWRNEQIAHGALRLDVEGFLNDLGIYLKELNTILRAQHKEGFWSGVALHVAGEPGDPLKGWRSIRERHSMEVPGPHTLEDVNLELHADGRILGLSPLLMVKRCSVCSKRDVFFFDSRKASGRSDQYHFLDYLAGHGMSRPGHLEPQLAAYARQLSADAAEWMESDDLQHSAYGRRSIDDFLLETSLKADYLSPVYLRRRLKEFVDTRGRGVFWLRAPAHCGKSVFVQGLVPAAALEKQPLAVGCLHEPGCCLKGSG